MSAIGLVDTALAGLVDVCGEIERRNPREQAEQARRVRELAAQTREAFANLMVMLRDNGPAESEEGDR